MKSKSLFCLLTTVLLITASIAEAQGPQRVYRIGYLTQRRGIEQQEEAFRDALRKLGYVEGQNIIIEWRVTNGQNTLFPKFASELVRLQVDCIVAVGIQAIRSAKSATSTIPIVMPNASDDPVKQGLIASFAKPSGNITGLTDISSDLAGKRLELLKETLPKSSRIGHLSDRDSPSGAAHLKEIEGAAPGLALQSHGIEMQAPDELENVFQVMAKRVDALIVASSGFINRHRKQVIDLAVKHRLPVIYTNPFFVSDGGLMSYSADNLDQFRRAAVLVDKILKGSKPADLPVERPRKFEFLINLKTAKQIGLTIPPNVLARADRVIR
jgi:putative ABC transport system substrate-binding protein